MTFELNEIVQYVPLITMNPRPSQMLASAVSCNPSISTFTPTTIASGGSWAIISTSPDEQTRSCDARDWLPECTDRKTYPFLNWGHRAARFFVRLLDPFAHHTNSTRSFPSCDRHSTRAELGTYPLKRFDFAGCYSDRDIDSCRRLAGSEQRLGISSTSRRARWMQGGCDWTGSEGY
jgi:hypothetical protein